MIHPPVLFIDILCYFSHRSGKNRLRQRGPRTVPPGAADFFRIPAGGPKQALPARKIPRFRRKTGGLELQQFDV
ncbi:hypothetical protein A7X67_03265 [Clostridium sp. W14A]|nr:hypothetical protein A7X67_03265 [Clostridium sp. W14A]